jgi:ribonuclease/clavin/mitogillin
MSEGFHRTFEVVPARSGVVVIPWRITGAGIAIWARLVEKGSSLIASPEGGELLPAMGPADPGPVLNAAAILAKSLGCTDPDGSLVRIGRFRTLESAPERKDLECFLLRVEQGVSFEGGKWRNAAEWRRAWAEGKAYPGPLLTAVLEMFAEGESAEWSTRFRAFAQSAHPRLGCDVEVFPLHTPTLPPATHTNCVLVGREQALIVDPASPYPEEQERLRALLESRMEAGVTVSRIVLTHHHQDHVGGVEALREAFDVPVAAHAQTAELLKGRVRVDEFLADGDRIPLGSGRMLHVLHTPGHAPGHLVLHSEEGGWMIAGDMVAGRGTIVIDPPEGDMIAYLAQLARMRDLDPRMLVPSHGPMILSACAMLQKLIDHRAWREGVILDALAEESGMGVDALVACSYGDVLPAVHPIASRQVEAILEKLLTEGRVERSPGLRWTRTEFP